MIRLLLTILLFVNSLAGLGQPYDNFRNDFGKALNDSFSEDELDKMRITYSAFLTPRIFEDVEGRQVIQYGLNGFKSDKLYKDHIGKLIESKNPNHRILAYLVIAGSGDISFETVLIKKIKEEDNKSCLIWSGITLLYLNTSRTTELFDFLVENETFGDAHMLPLFIRLNKDSLQQTAYSRIDSDGPMAKILAAQILSSTKLNSKTEQLLLKAVREWDISIKGYAIFSVKELQIGNLLETFKPLLDSSQTRGIALEALANSPTITDHQYLIELVNKQDTVSEELLNCFYKSKNIDNLKYWLQLLYTKPTPAKYYFSVMRQPLFQNDSILVYVHIALQKIKNPEILGELVRALSGKRDDKSTEILLSFLTNENSTVRYWTASALKGNNSPKLITKLPDLINNPAIRVVSLTDLAIRNKLNCLHSIYEKIYQTDKDADWRRSAVEYLSSFPLSRHREFFRKILKSKSSDLALKGDAALGLGRLKDRTSVELLISVCEEEAKTGELNARPYLLALSIIKGEKAKAEILKFKNSEERILRIVVEKLLKNWNSDKEVNIYDNR